MRAIERILCCTDLSENAVAAVHAAVRMAELHNAELAILYVVAQPDPSQSPLTEALRKRIQQRAQEEIAKTCPPEDDTPVRARTEIRHGPVKETILVASRELGADLIVAGTAGQTGNLARTGHVAEFLVRKGPSSVLLVRPEYADNFSKIAAAVDFSDFSRQAFDRAIDLAKRFEARKVNLFNVCHLPEEYWLTGRSEAEALKRVREFAKKHAQEFLENLDLRGVEVQVVIEEGRESVTIAGLAKKRKTDLLVLGSHGRTAGGAVLLGSVAERTLRACPSSMWFEIDPKKRIGVLQALGRIMGLSE